MHDRAYIEKSFLNDVEFQSIKDWLITSCHCKENQSYFNGLTPIYNTNKLNKELSYTDELFKSLLRKENLISASLKNISRAFISLNLKNGMIEIDEFAEIRSMLGYYLSLKEYFKGKRFENWKNKITPIDNPEHILNKINKVIDNESNVKSNASKELKQISYSIKQTDTKIESKMKQELGKYIKLGYLRENKIIFRSGKTLLPVNTSNKNKVKGVVDSFSATRQTCFIQPISLVELNNKLSELKSKEKKEITKILKELTSRISLDKNLLISIYNLIKYYDIHTVIACLAIKLDSVKPEFSEKLILKEAINPLFTLKKKKYVPLDITINNRNSSIVISGPNSGGKTVVIKSIGLYALMAQCGLYIPSKIAILPIFKSFLSDIGDKQSLNDDLSTFSAHMKEISSILKISNEFSLIIIDEMGTGTDPDIGASLSISILKKLTQKRSLNLCTTHLTPLKVWANENSNCENASMEFDNSQIKPTFIFKQGIPGSSYGIEIAERMGIGKDVINDASLTLNKRSFDMEELIKRINQKNEDMIKKINQLEEQQKALIKERKIYNQLKKELDEKIKIFKKRELSDSKRLILSYRKKIESIIEKIKINNANKSSIKEAKSYISRAIIDINDKQIEDTKINKSLSINDNVIIDGINEIASIINFNKKTKTAILQTEDKRITAKIKDLIPAPNDKSMTNKKYLTTYNVDLLESQRLDIRGKRVDEAILELDKFLDKAILANIRSVDILHGKGTGALQEAIHKYLKNLKFIKHFNFAPIDQGGSGITIVEIS